MPSNNTQTRISTDLGYTPPQQQQQQQPQQYPPESPPPYQPTPQPYQPSQPSYQPQPQPQPYDPTPPPHQQHYAPYTYLPLVSTNPGDITIYNKSAVLYNDMIAKYGRENILPPPDWLRTDKSRVAWLKRDQNALLYTFHKKKKYLNNMQTMLNSNILFSCCSRIQAGDWDESSGCAVACIELMTLNSLCNCTGDRIALLMYPQGFNDGCCLCCPPCLPGCGGLTLRRKFIKRINKAGLIYDESYCGSVFKEALCHCCVAAQMSNILMYSHQKRYGVQLINNLDKENYFIDSTSIDWVRYYQDMRLSPYHPYHHINTTLIVKEKVNKHHPLPYDPNHHHQQHHGYGSAGIGGSLNSGSNNNNDERSSIKKGDKSSSSNEKSSLLQHGPNNHHNHPQERHDEKYIAVAKTVINRRELLNEPGVPVTKALLEYYNPAKAIQYHNQRWIGIHQIRGLNME